MTSIKLYGKLNGFWEKITRCRKESDKKLLQRGCRKNEAKIVYFAQTKSRKVGEQTDGVEMSPQKQGKLYLLFAKRCVFSRQKVAQKRCVFF